MCVLQLKGYRQDLNLFLILNGNHDGMFDRMSGFERFKANNKLNFWLNIVIYFASILFFVYFIFCFFFLSVLCRITSHLNKFCKTAFACETILFFFVRKIWHNYKGKNHLSNQDLNKRLQECYVFIIISCNLSDLKWGYDMICSSFEISSWFHSIVHFKLQTL